MEVKDIQGNILIDAPITADAVKVDELMKQHSITLSWVAVSNEQLPLGAYIDYEGVRYSLLEPYTPEQSDEVTYNYKPQFQHPVMRWQYLPFFHYTDSNKELDWSLTDNPANFMAAICKAIENETGEDWSYEVSSALAASASLSFNNTDIFSALNSIASAFETEWWFDYASRTVYLSKSYRGTAVVLEVGQNIGVPSKNQSKEGYYTRFYGFGSTRNIEQDYQGSNVNNIVNRRLTLDPAKYPNGYIDIREGLTNSEVKVKTLVFDDIYPRSSLTISDVRVRLMWRLDDDNNKVPIGTDSEGNTVYDQYAIWYFRIPELVFSKDGVISGKPLSVHFNSGALNGREFELTYHDEEEKKVETSDGTDFIVQKGNFEINFIEEGTYIIPAITGLIPADGDAITLFNIIMPEEYKASAYQELESAVKAVIAGQGADNSNYTFDSNKVAFYENNPNLYVGRSVTYRNGSQTLSTRVIKLETKLDYPFEQKITIGNEQIKGTTQTLKEEVVSANQNIDLISAINQSTEAFTQSLQKTQKAVQNSIAKWADMWVLDKENNAARTKLNLIVEKSITFGGEQQGEGEEGGNGSGVGVTSLYALPEIGIDKALLKGGEVMTYDEVSGLWVAEKVASGLDETKLAQYLATNEYLNKTTANGLYASLASFSELNTKVVTFLESENLNDTIDRWKEVEKFLLGYTDQQTLAELLNAKADVAALSVYAKKSEIPSLEGYAKLTDIPSLSGYATQDWVQQQGYITAAALDGYATLDDIPAIPTALKNPYALVINGTSYDGSAKKTVTITAEGLGALTEHQDISHLATKTALNTTNTNLSNLQTAHNTLRNEFDALNGLLSDDTSGYIDTWNEVKSFLDGYADSDNLSTILSAMNADIATRATQSALNAAITRIGTLEGYFSSGAAKKAIADGNGNNIASTYATKTALQELAEDIAALQGMWSFFDSETIKTAYNVIVEKAITFGGSSQGSGDSGAGITHVTKQMVIDALGYTPYNATNPNNYITNTALNGYATQTWVENKGYFAASSFTKANIKSTLGIADWALAASKPTYTKSDVGLGNVQNTAVYTRNLGINGTQWTFASTYQSADSSSTSFYAPTTAGTANQYLVSNGSGAPVWLTVLPYDANLSRTANTVLAAPNGSAGAATFRKLVAADIPSLDWSKITSGKPTTVSGYGITDAITTAGGTVGDGTGFCPFMVKGAAANGAAIGFKVGSNSTGYLYYTSNGVLKLTNPGGSAEYIILHSGNYGNYVYSESEADARFFRLNTTGIDAAGTTDLNQGGYGYAAKGWHTSGPALAFGSTNGYTALIQQGATTPTLYVSYKSADGDIQDWKVIAFTDSIVAGAKKLAYSSSVTGLTVNSSGNVILQGTHLYSTAAHTSDLGTSSVPFRTVYTRYIDTYSGYDLRFKTGGTELMRITAASGCVILGGSSVADNSNYKLLVSGNHYVNGNIVATGAITFGSASDRRLKDNIKTMTDSQAVSVLSALNPVTFEWNSLANQLDSQLKGCSDGFIADEYEKVIKNSGRDIWANYRAIDYKRATGYLVKGWQNHETRVQRLERRVNELENELKQYRRAEYGSN